MKKTSLVPLLAVCLLLAVPRGGLLYRKGGALSTFPAGSSRKLSSSPCRPSLTRRKKYGYTPNGNQCTGIAVTSMDNRGTFTRLPVQALTAGPSLLVFGENGIVLCLLALTTSLCVFGWQRYRKMKVSVKNEKEEALVKAREIMEQEKQTALQLAYRLIREEKEMALRQAREAAVQQAREIIEQAREEARMLQAKVTSTSVMLANKNDYLQQLQEKLRAADNTDCKRIAKEIKTNLGETDHWADFITNFNLLHSHVIDKITKKHPDLTPNEIKLICFVLSGMSNKEIAGIFAVEPESVKKGRYRLKKKLQLKEEESLKFYLDNLED